MPSQYLWSVILHSFSLQPRFGIIFLINLEFQCFKVSCIDSEICSCTFAALSHSISVSISLIALKKFSFL